MFELNGQYENRKGKYTVVAIDGNMMTVRYKDKSEATLKMSIQERIWENILAEQEAAAAKATKKRTTVSTTKHYIKTITLNEDQDLAVPGLKQRIAVASFETELKPGDRLIYYAVEPSLFFAVATITTKPKKGKAKDYGFSDEPKKKVWIYPIDVDAQIFKASSAISSDSTELESIADNRSTLGEINQYILISEDDFEILGELITELDETEEDETEEEEEILEDESLLDG